MKSVCSRLKFSNFWSLNLLSHSKPLHFSSFCGWFTFSKFKSFLQPFSPILVSWSGRSQLKTLRSVDISSRKQPNVTGKHLMSAFYLNELILNFLTTADPYPDLFDTYSLAIENLSTADSSEIILREFEIELLT